MRKIIIFTFLLLNNLFSQDIFNDRDVKSLLRQSGLTQSEAKRLLKKEGIKLPGDKSGFINSNTKKEAISKEKLKCLDNPSSV